MIKTFTAKLQNRPNNYCAKTAAPKPKKYAFVVGYNLNVLRPAISVNVARKLTQESCFCFLYSLQKHISAKCATIKKLQLYSITCWQSNESSNQLRSFESHLNKRQKPHLPH